MSRSLLSIPAEPTYSPIQLAFKKQHSKFKNPWPCSHELYTRPMGTNLKRRTFQESGLLVVIVALGALLAFFGGKVRVPAFETNAQGERQRVFRVNAAGEREAVILEKNKFLN